MTCRAAHRAQFPLAAPPPLGRRVASTDSVLKYVHITADHTREASNQCVCVLFRPSSVNWLDGGAHHHFTAAAWGGVNFAPDSFDADAALSSTVIVNWKRTVIIFTRLVPSNRCWCMDNFTSASSASPESRSSASASGLPLASLGAAPSKSSTRSNGGRGDPRGNRSSSAASDQGCSPAPAIADARVVAATGVASLGNSRSSSRRYGQDGGAGCVITCLACPFALLPPWLVPLVNP